MRARIVANGPKAILPPDFIIRPDDCIIAADGGSLHALSWGWMPHVVIGDMDSLPSRERARLEAAGCRFVQVPAEKDETDLELAIRLAAKEGAQELLIFGALGGRTDHYLANVMLLALAAQLGIPARILDGLEEIRLIAGGEDADFAGAANDTLSLIPVGGDARGITTEGLGYPLRGETLYFGLARGISNVFTTPHACVKLEEGTLLAVHIRQEKDKEDAVWGIL
ncbi:MAG: thiamine diphosphokinase [Anaerolineae bacterium]|nr:thiamine diphosphokinase [Anaerolineae bacterium]